MDRVQKLVEEFDETLNKVNGVVNEQENEDIIPPIIAKLVDIIQTEFTVSYDTYATVGVPVDWSDIKLYDELMDRAKTVLHAASTAKTILVSFSQD